MRGGFPGARIPKVSSYIQLSVLGFPFGRFLAETTYQNKEGSRGFIDAKASLEVCTIRIIDTENRREE